jgi:O-antigen ligase
MIWLFGVAWLHQKKPLDLDRLYKLIIVVGVFVGISTLTVFYAQNPVSERLSGWSVARNPIVVAQIFGVAVLLAWVQSWREINQRRSWIYFIAALVSLLPGLMSQSRGPLLALALTLFLAFLLLRPAARVWLPQFALLFVAALVYMALSWTSLDVIKRGFDLTYRDQIWGYVITLIPENFWFGLGVSKDTKLIIADVGIFHHAHNAYLDTLYRTGVFGLILLVAHLGVLLRCWRKNKQLLPLYLWLVFGVLCVMSNTRILFWQLDAKWFLYWIPAGLIAAVQISSLSCMRESKSDRYSAL